MLAKAVPEDIGKYGGLAYRLALDPARSSYPAYGDGVKTEADFFRAAAAAVTDETSELLLFSLDGRVEGWISYFWLPAEKYLQLTGCSIRRGTEQALEELTGRLEAAFGGYTAYFGFPGENRAAADFLAEHGFQCAERGWNHTFSLDGYAPGRQSPRVERVTRQNFDAFRALWQPAAGTYWTAARILEVMEDWRIFVYPGAAAPAAAVLLTGGGECAEVFGTAFLGDVFQERALSALLTAALTACRERGERHLTYICPERERAVLGALGFRCVGEYVLYTKALS